ncbi:homocysteine S-methyltransferase [Scopulibacillus daqui]|uniref:Homocysteine S-methyltransferase n=1 Tax=Scopulibacillus daqui TaxID=1469162 RepID=A0ABS2Q3V3_9BACL|nr:bifunctional homocysteine S-methyltransferase/methylenetetrahydrofolate reductase [Scopulibacillus daqui]MBM7646806.1 homocysteine S-methyltransferase [Scopulibacillus daqui]
MGLIDELKTNILIADGAMGTMLYANGIDRCFEELNLSEPEQVLNVHMAYIDAGARVIQTNTYAANALKLARYGLERDVKTINKEAVRIARKAAGNRSYILGTIGAIRGVEKERVNLSDIKESFIEQFSVLMEENVDGIILETYYDFEELTEVLAIARKETELPVIAQLSVHEPGVLQNGMPVSEAFRKLEADGADVVGLNCRLGPHYMVKSFENIPIPEHSYLSAYPNGGLLEYHDGHLRYRTEPDYFAKNAEALAEQGVRLIGGCCGTTPDHIKAICRTLSNYSPVNHKVIKQEIEQIAVRESDNETREPGLNQIVRSRASVIVELDTPKNLNFGRFMEGAKALKEAGIDALTMADNSLATPRISNVAAAVSIKNELNIRPLVHIACRDRNLVGLQSHLMGLHTLGIDQVLAITGDPTKIGDFPGATSVYDCSSFGLIELCKQFNQGISYSGQPLGEKTFFSVGAAFNPNVHHLDKAVRRLERKIKAGADYFMTQPVYSEQQIADIYEATKHLDVPFYIGIMPLVSSRNAEFLHHEVPGIQLPNAVREKMAQWGNDRENAVREGIAIAKHLIDAALNYFNGIYLITPFLRYDISVELVRYIHKKTAHLQVLT